MIKTATFLLSIPMLLVASTVYSQDIDTEPCVTNTWEWATTIDNAEDYESNSNIIADISGNVYVSGNFTSSITLGDSTYQNLRGNDGYMAKYNASGLLLWSVHVIRKGGSSLSIATDVYDNIYIAGDFEDTLVVDGNILISDSNSRNIFIAKFNTNKTLQWIKQYGGVNYDALGDIESDQLGNIFLTGTFSGSTEIEDFPLNSNAGNDFLFKVNIAGNVEWVEQFGNSYIWGTTLAIKANNNIVVSGVYNGTLKIQDIILPPPSSPTSPNLDAVFLAEFSSGGDVQWLKQATLGSNSIVNLRLDREDAIYIGGNFFDEDFIVGDSTYTGPAGFIAKYDTQGNPLWSRKIGDYYFNHVSGIAVDAANNLFISGLITSTIDFGGQPYTGNGSFLAKYDPSGGALKLWSTGTFSYDRSAFITSDPNGIIYCTGIFEGITSFGDHSVTVASGYHDIFITKLGASGPFLSPEPDFHTSRISFSNITPNSAELSWTNGDGMARVVVAKKLGKVNATSILDGTAYNDGGGVFGSGTQTNPRQFVVYNGTGTFTTVTGLKPGTLYSFTSLEYNEDASCPNAMNYKTDSYKISYFITPGAGAVTENINVFPNPVKEGMNVTLTTGSRGTRELALMDKSGNLLQKFTMNVSEDVTSLNIDLSGYNLSPGIYYLKLDGIETERNAFRILKE